MLADDVAEAFGDELERLSPPDATEPALTLAGHAHRGIEQPVFGVDATVEAAHLAADQSPGRWRGGAAVDARDSAFFDVNRQRTRVGTIEGTSGVNGRAGHGGRIQKPEARSQKALFTFRDDYQHGPVAQLGRECHGGREAART